MASDELGPVVEVPVARVKDGVLEPSSAYVATEVPCTFVVNGVEAATLLCTPTHLPELAVGFLFSSGMIRGAGEIRELRCDTARWRVDAALDHDVDFELLGKRVYTSGCGKGVMYENVVALSLRHPLQTDFAVPAGFVVECNRWLQRCSETYRTTHGIHTAALSRDGAMPELFMDDIGRHNAVDKVIGHALLAKIDFGRTILLCTGRVSSEILQKVRRCGTPIVLSRGVPTHQTILMAREMGITVVGFARGTSFAVYTHPERIAVAAPPEARR